MSKKCWPNLYSNFLYKMGQDFLDTQYWLVVTVISFLKILSRSQIRIFYLSRNQWIRIHFGSVYVEMKK